MEKVRLWGFGTCGSGLRGCSSGVLILHYSTVEMEEARSSELLEK
jgi:hypothetical protein